MLNEELFKYITDLIMEKGTLEIVGTSNHWGYMDILYCVDPPSKYLDFFNLYIHVNQSGQMKGIKIIKGDTFDYSVSHVLSEIYNHIHKDDLKC